MKQMPSRKVMVTGCIITLVVILVPLIAGVITLFNTKGLTEKVAAIPDKILVTLTDPVNGSHYPVNGIIPIVTKIVSKDEKIQTLELWAGGNLMESYTVPANEEHKLSYRWEWIPPAEGDYLVQARAISTTGNTGFSNLVTVTATEPQSVGVQIAAKAGDTIASIAAEYQVAPEDIRTGTQIDAENYAGSDSAGSQYTPDFTAPLKDGETVVIPTTPEFTPSIPKWTPSDDPAEENAEIVEGADVEALDHSVLDRVNGLINSADTLPATPDLRFDKTGCTVHLIFRDNAENEKGFYIYRRSGLYALDRIAILDPNSENDTQEFIDKNQSGLLYYYISAFNAAGESPSNPVSVDMDQSCQEQAAENPGLDFDKETNTLTLPAETDLAYVYLRGNGSDWMRVPSNPNEFFENKGTSVNLTDAINLLPILPPVDNDVALIEIEAWGWQGESIVYLGTLTRDIYSFEDTVLQICMDECPESEMLEGAWEDYEVSFAPGDDHPWQFSFRSVNKALHASAANVVLQISAVPFSSDDSLMEGATTISKSYDAVVQNIIYDPDDPQKYGDQVENGNQAILLLKGMTYYARAVPMMDGQIVGYPSNVIRINIQDPAAPPVIFLETPKEMPAAFTVDILGFDPLHFPEAGVCRGRLVVEEDYSYTFDPDIYNVDPITVSFAAGSYICPDIYRGEVKTTWELIWEGFTQALATISQIWETIKQVAVDSVGAVVCGGDETCKSVLMAGLNAGLVALGIPPTIPNLDQLLEEGVGMLAAEIATELTNTQFAKDLIADAIAEGYITDQSQVKKFLTEKIAEGLEAGIDELGSSLSASENPGCESEEEAHSRGVEPVCYPGLKTHLDSMGQHLPPVLKLQITRSATEGLDLTETDLEQYWITTTFSFRDDGSHVGRVISNPTPNGENMTISGPLSGELLTLKTIRAPYLEPGESTTVSLVPRETEYWVPGHLESLNGWSTQYCNDGQCVDLSTDDWWLLYYGSTVTIDVTVKADCVSANYQYAWNYDPALAVCETASAHCEAGPMPDSMEPFNTFCQ
jgi:hypothetical protein